MVILYKHFALLWKIWQDPRLVEQDDQVELCLGRAAEGDPPRHGAVPAPFVELVEEVDEGSDEGLAAIV